MPVVGARIRVAIREWTLARRRAYVFIRPTSEFKGEWTMADSVLLLDGRMPLQVTGPLRGPL